MYGGGRKLPKSCQRALHALIKVKRMKRKEIADPSGIFQLTIQTRSGSRTSENIPLKVEFSWRERVELAAVVYRCLPLSSAISHCMPLSASISHCMPLSAAYQPLYAAVCRLSAIVCRCLPLSAIVCRCLPHWPRRNKSPKAVGRTNLFGAKTSRSQNAIIDIERFLWQDTSD